MISTMKYIPCCRPFSSSCINIMYTITDLSKSQTHSPTPTITHFHSTLLTFCLKYWLSKLVFLIKRECFPENRNICLSFLKDKKTQNSASPRQTDVSLLASSQPRWSYHEGEVKCVSKLMLPRCASVLRMNNYNINSSLPSII